MSSTITPHAVILGFDFGLKRIGVAVGQVLTKTATPLTTLIAKQGHPSWEQLTVLVKRWEPQAFVIGIPLNMDGSEQPITELARHFARNLHSHYQLPVYEMDERLSTVDARARIYNEQGYKGLQEAQIDSVAAQLILQNWLETEHNGEDKT